MRHWLLLVFFACPLLAQFSELASTDDGAQMYFTSTLQLSGNSPDRGEHRIFRITETGLALFAERGARATPSTFSSSDGAQSPQVSGDGRTVGITLYGVCPVANSCSNSMTQAELRGVNAMVLGPGALTMSRNARWALLAPTGQTPGNMAPVSVLIDLQTGERADVPGLRLPIASPLASDGTLIGETSGATPGSLTMGLWRQGNFTPLVLEGPTNVWGISDNAQVLVYTRVSGIPSNPMEHLVARRLATGEGIEIASAALVDGTLQPMGLSDNGQWLLYRRASPSGSGPAFVTNTAAGESMTLTLPDNEVVTGGTLSGYGNVAFLVTSSGRIVSVDVTAVGMGTRILVPSTP